MLTYAVRVALRSRPLRSGTITNVGERTTPEVAAEVESVIAKRLAPIPDQPRRLHDAGQHGHHQHPHDLPPRRPAASHAAHRDLASLADRCQAIVTNTNRFQAKMGEGGGSDG